MRPITPPLRPGDHGAEVGNLQEGLILLLNRQVIQTDPGTRQELLLILTDEVQAQQYRDATAKSVALFQEQHHLHVTGEVDAPTAEALNARFNDLGALDTARDGQKRVVAGQVVQDDHSPFKGTVILFQDGGQGSLRLGEDATDPEGRFTIGYDSALGLEGTRLRLVAFDPDGKQRADATLEAARPVEIVNLIVPREAPAYRVEGKVASRAHAGVGELGVQIVDKNVGADVTLATTSTTEDGSYGITFPYAGPKQKPDLQARVFAGETFLGASEVRYNASNAETLNVLLPGGAAAALASEHETLTGALSAHFQGRLRDLQETDDRQDITYLANKAGWDARAVALAALADQFSARTADPTGAQAIPPAFFYALFRAGLPANEDVLYHADAATLEGIWKQAAEQGVIPKTLVDQIPTLIERFQALSADKLLTGPALVGASPLKEMLTVSGLDEDQQATFARLYAAHRTDMSAFWRAVGEALPQVARRLQVDGKLAFLTVNNASLMQKVHETAGPNGLSDPVQLAQMGYHRPDKWDPLLANVPIPKEIPGDKPETRRANYARYLAAQVRLSYPTAAVAEMVQSRELPLTGAPDELSDQVHVFLTEHQGKFEIGAHPVEQYIARNQVQAEAKVVQQVKRLQRVYQLTPNDQAMIGLMKRGIDAAYHVVRYDKETFVQTFAEDLGGTDPAALTYDKAVQVHNAVLNVALGYLHARTAPAIGVHSPPSVVDPTPAQAGDVIAYATLEKLFGSMDFCACEHCRSILSPAAYLVDLLLFLDQPHPPQGTENPQTVLLERRPDIQHLPLTCENTNTALPYIDLVNETLEYYIANSIQKLSLKDYKGHDTGSTASEDLLAGPQFVMDAAYTTLRNEYFPAPLPFHQPLEALRRYFNKFEVPPALAMERLRKTDDLERGGNPYGWRDIWMEELGLSRAEYEILTDSTVVPLWRMYGFPNGTADADVVAGLSNAKQFARRLGITYEELIAILKAQFINPNGDLIPKLERLKVSLVALKALKDGTISDSNFDALLPTGLTAPDPAEYGGDIKSWVKNNDNYARIMGLVTLAIPAATWAASTAYALGNCVRPTAAGLTSTLYYVCTKAGTSGATEPKWPTISGATCNDGTVEWTCRDAADCLGFEDLAFRYSDPGKLTQNIGAVEFVRLLRFIRLWKKLGWTIEETDVTICALYRADLKPPAAGDINTIEKLDAGFKTLLPRLGIVLRVMKTLNLMVKRDLRSLLACWSDIGTYGDGALYRQMFLNPAILRQDPIFADNGYGEFLTDATRKLADHAEALRAAFNLTGDEYDRIVAALGYDANTVLTLPHIGAIFRRGWLARKLKLSVRELLLLIRLASLDPFAAPDPVHPAILRLIALIQAMKERSLKSAAALYLIWNQDLSGKSAPAAAQVAAFARTLRQALAAVEAEFTVAADPDGATAQAQLAKVYGAAAAAFFLGLLNDTLTVEGNFGDPDGTMAPGPVRQAIEAAAGKTEAGAPRIAYDDFRKRLSYTGVLSATTRDALKIAAGGGAAAFKNAVDDLYTKNRAAIGPFFARYPELQLPYEAYFADMGRSAAEKRSKLLQAILPELIRRRKRQQALQALSAAANAGLDFTQTLLDPSAVPFPLHTVGQTDRPALNDVLALETQGLSVEFFAADTATGTPMSGPNIPNTAANLDYAPTVNPLPANPTPGNAISGIWHGYLEAPESGFFNLYIEADVTATVTLELDGKPAPLTQAPTRWQNADAIELRAGALYEVKLKVEKVKDIIRVQWEWTPKGQGRTAIPAHYLYPAVLFEHFRETYVRFFKVASLATGLGLTAGELAYFAVHGDYRINGDGWLNALSVKGDPEQAVARALLKPLEALLDFARIKAEISPGDESLLAVLQDPAKATQNPDSLLFAITRWNSGSLNELLAWFGGNVAGLGSFERFRRVYDAMALVRRLGISAKVLTQATTNEPTTDAVRELQGALRARYDATSWRDVIRPINDEMRALQRDALVAYILHQMRSHPESAHIDMPEKLFEYFLMDVQMDPCMLTSRIRFVLSSVQLFIERCLMNLEPRVSPATINAEQWPWMKRYRVWEANRKVYLFPENWLEPELRDDPSPFFKETMSELLQGDITEERATTALLNYLSKLEEVAKLEPCGLHYVPADPAKRTGEVVHVVARTAGVRRKYYYRRYECGYWTPWEEIRLDIEDNPVIPVVWNDRLFLFWLRILKQGPNTVEKPFSKEGDLVSLKTSDIKTDPPNMEVRAVLCWSEYYNGKWQGIRTSDVARPLGLGKSAPDSFDRSRLRLSVLFWTKGALRIIVSYENSFGASFFLHNAYSTPELREGKKEPHFSPKRALETTTDALRISYPDFNTANDVVHNAISDRAVQPNHPVDGDSWDPPFFYEDARHVFYVTTSGHAAWIPEQNDFGIPVKPPFVVPHIPPLVVTPIPIPDPIGPVARRPGFGIIDPSPVERYITEDAYIRRGIGTSGTVRYGEKEIGVAGSQVKSRRTR